MEDTCQYLLGHQNHQWDGLVIDFRLLDVRARVLSNLRPKFPNGIVQELRRNIRVTPESE